MLNNVSVISLFLLLPWRVCRSFACLNIQRPKTNIQKKISSSLFSRVSGRTRHIQETTHSLFGWHISPILSALRMTPISPSGAKITLQPMDSVRWLNGKRIFFLETLLIYIQFGSLSAGVRQERSRRNCVQRVVVFERWWKRAAYGIPTLMRTHLRTLRSTVSTIRCRWCRCSVRRPIGSWE